MAIRNIIYVEDGSIDVDDLLESLDETTKVIVYRQGSKPPILVQPENPVNDLFDGEIARLKNQLRALRKRLTEILLKESGNLPPGLRSDLDEICTEAKVD